MTLRKFECKAVDGSFQEIYTIVFFDETSTNENGFEKYNGELTLIDFKNAVEDCLENWWYEFYRGKEIIVRDKETNESKKFSIVAEKFVTFNFVAKEITE